MQKPCDQTAGQAEDDNVWAEDIQQLSQFCLAWLNIHFILSLWMFLVRRTIRVRVCCVLFVSALHLTQINWTHPEQTMFLFHRSSSAPSANITSSFGFQTESEMMKRDSKRRWRDKEITTRKKKEKEKTEVFCCFCYLSIALVIRIHCTGFLCTSPQRDKHQPTVAAESLFVSTSVSVLSKNFLLSSYN